MSKNLKDPNLHCTEFMKLHYKKLEENDFELVKKLNNILINKKLPCKSRKFACFDLGEFCNLYPSANILLNRLQVKQTLIQIIQSKKESCIKEAAIEALQKIVLKNYRTCLLYTSPSPRD